MQGIGLAFNSDKLMTPMMEPSVYGTAITPPMAFALNLDVPYNMITLKVAYSGDASLITGIDIGNSK